MTDIYISLLRSNNRINHVANKLKTTTKNTSNHYYIRVLVYHL